METRHSVECWMFGEDGRVLLLHVPPRDEVPAGFWQPVTGGIEPGETPQEAAAREVTEETGLAVPPARFARVRGDLRVTIDNDHDVLKTLFAVDLPAGDVRIDPDEHDDSRWLPADDVSRALHWQSNLWTWRLVREFREASA